MSKWIESFTEREPVKLSKSDMARFAHQAQTYKFFEEVLEVRQGLYAQLAGVDLSTESGRFRAAHIQGQIFALDMLPDIMQSYVMETDDG